ncbi:MAG: GntR family transcriptional regulator [Vallitaleaceae bacterium]|nr:GntR family transcriptional regulator [Vallitaleaceae bacterium]
MEFNTSIPIYLQVMDLIKKQLILGILTPGEQLPSTRSLAITYNVNPNTAARIYKELELEGICFTKRGLGTFVTDSTETISKLKGPMAQRVIDHFIAEMTELGYNFEDMLTIIKEKGRE